MEGLIIEEVINKFGFRENLSDKNLNSNYTLSIRYSLNENKSIDFYSSNALGTQDLGQLLISKDNRLGIKLNFLY